MRSAHGKDVRRRIQRRSKAFETLGELRAVALLGAFRKSLRRQLRNALTPRRVHGGARIHERYDGHHGKLGDRRDDDDEAVVKR